MNISFFNGVSGMIAYQEEMNRISHNIANANTNGYKPLQSSFSELLYTHMAVNSPEEPWVGHGVKITEPLLDYTQGAPLQTGITLDFALNGDGFFAVERPNGNVEYTRNGAFNISIEGSKAYLVMVGDGSHVLDSRGRHIELTRESKNDPYDLSALKDQIGIYDFSNPYALEPTGGTCYKETDASGEAETIRIGRNRNGRSYQLLSGALEQSAVNLADEMVDVITAQKAFQFNAKMVQTADELEQIINNLRG